MVLMREHDGEMGTMKEDVRVRSEEGKEEREREEGR